MNKLRNRVERLFKLGVVYRDSKKLTMLSIWEDEGLALTPGQREVFLNKCTPAESITRKMRELAPLYPPSEKVREMRYQKAKEYRDEYGQPVIFNFRGEV